MKLCDEAKNILKQHIEDGGEVSAWIVKEQRGIDECSINFKDETLSGIERDYAPWMGGKLVSRKDIPFNAISIIEVTKTIGTNKMILGFK